LSNSGLKATPHPKNALLADAGAISSMRISRRNMAMVGASTLEARQ
jgi:hypothetical protein